MASKESTQRRAQRIRRQVKAVANGRLRLSVYRSSKNIHAQVIDDANGHTVASASSLEKDLKGSLKTGADVAAAAAVGKLVAERATFDALKSQMHPKDVAAQRGIKYSTLQARRGTAVAAEE